MMDRQPNVERLIVLEQKFQHLEDQVERMASKVDDIHSTLLMAKGFKIPFVVMGTAVAGSIGAIAHWLLAKFG